MPNKNIPGSPLVHQVSDSGLDESSCYFADDSGEEVEHGHYFEELGLSSSYVVASTSDAVRVFEGGDFQFDETRRKVKGKTTEAKLLRTVA